MAWVPKPDGKYIDIITTTAPSNASNAYAVQDLITRLTQTNAEGQHEPKTVRSLITDLDQNSSWFKTMYGIHGIDDNPTLHPYGNTSLQCEGCGSDADCGGPGNVCVGGACAAECSANRGCDAAFTCGDIANANMAQIVTQACVPTSGGC